MKTHLVGTDDHGARNRTLCGLFWPGRNLATMLVPLSGIPLGAPPCCRTCVAVFGKRHSLELVPTPNAAARDMREDEQ